MTGFSNYRSTLAVMFFAQGKNDTLPMNKVAIFVDVQNVYYTAKQAFGKNYDYNKFWQMATRNRKVNKAVAYAIDRGDPKQQEFQNILRAIGFEVKLKPYIQRSDGSAKGDWDVGITIDIMECADACDVVVLVSGDGDFDLLASKVRDEKGKRVEVYGCLLYTSPSPRDLSTSRMPSSA